MSRFGLKIFNENLPDTVLNSSCTMCCILGICNVEKTHTGIYVPDGYQYYIHLLDGSGFNLDYAMDADGTNLWVCGAFDSRSYLDGNRQVILYNGSHAWGYGGGSGSGYHQLCIVIGYPINTAVNGVGISFEGENNYFYINESSLCAPVIYRGEIDINKTTGWQPSYVNPFLNFENSIVFVYSENPNISIGGGFNHDTWEHILLAYNTEGERLNYDIKIKVVIFAKTQISNTKSNYGLRIFNKSGDVVFDSSTGVLINPQLHSFGTVDLRQFVDIPNIRRPMFIPTSIGGYVDFDNYDGIKKQIGLASTGFSLAPSYINHEYNSWTRAYKGQFISDFPIMIIDAENYFKF